MTRTARRLGAIAIFLFVAAMVVIPNFLRTRMAPGETSVVSDVRTIHSAEIAYSSMFPKAGFSTSLAELGGGPCTQPTEQRACLINDVLASGRKSGYRYNYAPVRQRNEGPVIGYIVHGDPYVDPPNWLERLFHVQQQKAQRYLFSDQSGVIRSEMGKEAGLNSPPL